MRIGYIAVAVGNEPSMIPVEEILQFDHDHDIIVFVDHATAAVDALAAAEVEVHVAVKSYLELPGVGVVLADAGQARSLAAMHATEPFGLLFYDQRRCADLAWHQPELAGVPIMVRQHPATDKPPWQHPYDLQQQGFVQAADVTGTSASSMPVAGPRPVRDVRTVVADDILTVPIAENPVVATVRHTPEMAEVGQRMAALMARSPADLILGGRPRGPHGDADAAYLCHHVAGLGPAAHRALAAAAPQGDTPTLPQLCETVVSAGGGVLVVPVAAHGCDTRSFASPLPPMAQATHDWVVATPLHRRAAAALPSRGGLVERGLYLAEAPAGVIAWCRQRPWDVRRLAGLPRNRALHQLDRKW